MKKAFLFCLMGIFAISSYSQYTKLGGYFYGSMSTPTGNEWQSVDSLAYNKEQPHSWFFSFENIDDARNVLPQYSSLYKSLDGKWSFYWSKNYNERPVYFFKQDYDVSNWNNIDVPGCWNVQGIQKDGTLKYGKPVYSNVRAIFQYEVKENDWKKGVVRTPDSSYLTYENRNEVGSYRKNFTVPGQFKNKEIFINFDGVDCFFYIYINGKYVGFSKNSRNTASFNITEYLNIVGDNTVAVEVYRLSDGSFFENQDFFRLPGIIRSVYLTAKPKINIKDIVAIPNLDNEYKNAELNISTTIKNYSGSKIKDYSLHYSLYKCDLYGDNTEIVQNVVTNSSINSIAKNGEVKIKSLLNARTLVNLWSAEEPNRYVLMCQLKDKKGHTVDIASINVGFRKVEIKETAAQDDEFNLAGKYFYLNGKPIKLKGVNRHETSTKTGHAISHKQMEKEIMLMKKANINHVRTSHYPDDPYWYYLCDKYGIYIMDEANLETHQYYYGQASLSHVERMLYAHISRNMEMVHSDVNHPCVVLWSMGNEAGPGENFRKTYDAIKAFDTSRPVQYERNNNFSDIGCNQYPPVAWVEKAVKGKDTIKYPFHINEYAHSMGNACGNLIDYWNAIESSNFFIGGAIWDWVDQAIDKPIPYKANATYWAYGGDFQDKPNDGMFCMNGLLRPDFTPKPQYYEVKKVYQNVDVKAIDIRQGKIEIFNKNYFITLEDYDMVWSLYKDGQPISEVKTIKDINIAPRQKKIIKLDINYSGLEAESEYFVKIQFQLNKNKPWANRYYVQMEEQLLVKSATKHNDIVSKGKMFVHESEKIVSFSNENFNVCFDKKQGTIMSLEYNGNKVITDGNGPKLDTYRAIIDNDNWAEENWLKLGLHNLHHKAKDYSIQKNQDDSYTLNFTVESKAYYRAFDTYQNQDRDPETTRDIIDNVLKPIGKDGFKFISNQMWIIYPDGTIKFETYINSNNNDAVLARLGYSMILPTSYDNYIYYGRGPWNNYNDRKSSQFIEIYSSKVAEQGVVLPKPQAMGNREDVRWSAITDKDGKGIMFIANPTMCASVLPWTQMELTEAAHPYQLPKPKGTIVHLDAKVTGLGGNSCGQGGPLEKDRVKAKPTNFKFTIRPIKNGEKNYLINISKMK